MATKKPGKMFKSLERPFTRKEYIDGIPGIRLRNFEMGNRRVKDGAFPVKLSLLVTEGVQIKDNALEAARIAANKHVSSEVGSSNFYLKVRVYPHQVLRENKLAVGAGADRISQGMRGAFGRPIGRAARVQPGQKIMSLWVKPETYEIAKDALRRAGQKLPSPIKIEVDEGREYLRGKI